MSDYFEKKIWFDRETEHPHRYIVNVIDEENGIYEITRLEGEVYSEGDPLDAQTFTDLETRIVEALEKLEKYESQARSKDVSDLNKKIALNYNSLSNAISYGDSVLNNKIDSTNANLTNKINGVETGLKKDISSFVSYFNEQLRQLEYRVERLERRN